MHFFIGILYLPYTLNILPFSDQLLQNCSGCLMFGRNFEWVPEGFLSFLISLFQKGLICNIGCPRNEMHAGLETRVFHLPLHPKVWDTSWELPYPSCQSFFWHNFVDIYSVVLLFLYVFLYMSLSISSAMPHLIQWAQKWDSWSCFSVSF